MAGNARDHARADQPQPTGYDKPTRPLPIPELNEGEKEGDTRRFELAPQEGSAEILPGVKTKTWGYNGPYLGPTLRAHKDERVQFSITNHLPEMTTVHWHGMKLPAEVDGGPLVPIEPDESWHPDWEVVQEATMNWYHPHPHKRTTVQSYRGLGGLFILDDDVSDGLDIPRTYGVDDVPVIVSDAKFTEDGQLDEDIDLGDTPVVNGITNPHFQATTRRVRLRVLNSATMRFYTLALDDASPLTVLATDSGFLDKPRVVDSILLSPGERSDFVIDVAPGKTINLQSVPRGDDFGIPDAERAETFGFRDIFQLLEIRGPEESAPEVGDLPAELEPNANNMPDLDGVTERGFVLEGMDINGRRMDMHRVDEVIDKDAPEIWKVSNADKDKPHNFHVHDARFAVLSMERRDGDEIIEDIPVPTYGWKDTIALPPKSVARLAVEFGYFPDPHVPYMYHCHMLPHEDKGMMGQFSIVKPGEKPDVIVPDNAMGPAVGSP